MPLNNVSHEDIKKDKLDIFTVVHNGNPIYLRAYLEVYPDQVNQPAPANFLIDAGKQPLEIALIDLRNPAVAEELLEKGARLVIQQNIGGASHVPGLISSYIVATSLDLKKSAAYLKKIIAQRYDGITPLTLAVRYGSNEEVMKLITNKVSIVERDQYDRTALHYAITDNRPEIVIALLSGIILMSQPAAASLFFAPSHHQYVVSTRDQNVNGLLSDIPEGHKKEAFKALLEDNHIPLNSFIPQFTTLHFATVLQRDKIAKILKNVLLPKEYDSFNCPLKVQDLEAIFNDPAHNNNSMSNSQPSAI
jgi:ankyrin repeat protein